MKTTKKHLKKIIKACQKHFKHNLMGGNCGTFAIALSEYLKKFEIDTTLVIFCDYSDENTSETTLKNIINYETSVYHIAIKIKNTLYDGDGKVSSKTILKWINKEYKDTEPFYCEFSSKDKDWHTLINQDTNWTISSKKFKKFIKTIKKS